MIGDVSAMPYQSAATFAIPAHHFATSCFNEYNRALDLLTS
jgi:hypothetical protein